jgi:hypothetical protein
MKDKIRDDEGRMVTVRTVYIPETSTHPEDDQILAQVAEINKEKLDSKEEV